MNEFNYDDSAYLAHHGVKGMKWGVRKDKSAYRTSSNIKQFIRRNGKKIAIGAGVATIGAAALGAGIGLAKNQKLRQNRYENRANKNYKKQQAIIERIKNDPNAYNAGNKYAKTPNAGTYDVGRVKAITGAIAKNNPRSNYRATARAQYTQKGGISTRINSNPNAHVTGGQYAQAVRNNAVIERIKNNPNAYSAGNKYAKKPTRS